MITTGTSAVVVYLWLIGMALGAFVLVALSFLSLVRPRTVRPATRAVTPVGPYTFGSMGVPSRQ